MIKLKKKNHNFIIRTLNELDHCNCGEKNLDFEIPILAKNFFNEYNFFKDLNFFKQTLIEQ